MNASSKPPGWIENRQLLLAGPIDDGLSNDLIARLLFLNSADGHRPIHLLINSAGGSVVAGLAIYDTIKDLTCPVHTFSLGLTAGIALHLLAGGKKGMRGALQGARFVLIRAHIGGATGEIDATTEDRVSMEMQRLENALCRSMAAETGLPERTFADLLRNGSYMFDVREALRLRFIDYVGFSTPV